MNKYWTYPKDSEIRTWLTLVWPVTEATWKHLDEYADPDATPDEKRRYEAYGRGIQQAGFRIHDEWKKPGLDADDLMDAVTLFYLAGLEVARLLDEKDNGAVKGSGIRELAENLLRAAESWYSTPRQKILEPQ